MALFKISKTNSNLSKSDKKIFKYVNQYPQKIATFTIYQLALETNVSVASVQRFCRKMGYSGFKDFKFELNNELKEQNKKVSDNDGFYLKKITDSINHLSTDDKNTLLLIKSLTNSDSNILLGNFYSAVPTCYLYNGLIDLGYTSIYATNISDSEHILNAVKTNSTIVLFSIHGLLSKYTNYKSSLLTNKSKHSFLITMNKESGLKDYFAHTIILPGMALSNQFAMDPQSIPVLFVEILLNKIYALGLKK